MLSKLFTNTLTNRRFIRKIMAYLDLQRNLLKHQTTSTIPFNYLTKTNLHPYPQYRDASMTPTTAYTKNTGYLLYMCVLVLYSHLYVL